VAGSHAMLLAAGQNRYEDSKGNRGDSHWPWGRRVVLLGWLVTCLGSHRGVGSHCGGASYCGVEKR